MIKEGFNIISLEILVIVFYVFFVVRGFSIKKLMFLYLNFMLGYYNFI